MGKFKELFTEEEVAFPPHLDNLISATITMDDNESLCSIPTPQEIKATLFHMQDLKAPSPDNFLVAFYKNYWPIMGEDVINAVNLFFTRGSMPKEINSSLIILIPKVSNPSSFNNYRPISLCNIIYKIISKLLVTRIRPLLPKLISLC